MDIEQALRIVRTTVATQFSVPLDQIAAQTVALDVPGWDSFSNGLLIMALEDAVGRTLPFDRLVSADDVGGMAEIIAECA